VKPRWTPVAAHHLQAVYDYLARERPAAANDTIDRVLAAIEALEAFPHLGRSGRVPGTRELVVAGTPFIAAYRLRKRDVEILAVLHAARRWPDHV